MELLMDHELGRMWKEVAVA